MTTRRLALAGLTGPPLFAALVVLVTALEWDFLHDLGWSAEPFDSPDPPWPSSTALGDWGFLAVLAFVVLGICVLALSIVLFRILEARRKVGPVLLALAGSGVVVAAVRTDYGSAGGGGPETWNGTVHAVGLTIFISLVVLSMFVLAAQFRRDERWRPMSRYSLIAGLAVLASLVAFLAFQCSVFFWIFLALVLAWLTLTSARALSLDSWHSRSATTLGAVQFDGRRGGIATASDTSGILFVVARAQARPARPASSASRSRSSGGAGHHADSSSARSQPASFAPAWYALSRKASSAFLGSEAVLTAS